MHTCMTYIIHVYTLNTNTQDMNTQNIEFDIHTDRQTCIYTLTDMSVFSDRHEHACLCLCVQNTSLSKEPLRRHLTASVHVFKKAVWKYRQRYHFDCISPPFPCSFSFQVSVQFLHYLSVQTRYHTRRQKRTHERGVQKAHNGFVTVGPGHYETLTSRN